MNKNTKPIDQLTAIRSLMERSSRFISLSGLSGVSAGVAALLGAYIAWWYLNSRPVYIQVRALADNPGAEGWTHLAILTLIALAIAAIAISSGIYFTTRNARKKSLPVWDNLAKLTLYNLAIPLVSGALFCFVLVYYGYWTLIAPSTLIFYGLALINGSKYTLMEIRYLGITEIVTGLIACFFPGYSLVFWAIGFGVFHILYGVLMYLRYER